MGSVGNWKSGKNLSEALDLVSKTFKTKVLRHNSAAKKSFNRVAVLGGAGMEFYSAAKISGADIFIAGDIRYHDFYRAKHDGILLIGAGHAETERFVTAGM